MIHPSLTALLPSRRDLRLASGSVLFTYLTLHLVCHALGLVSLDTAESALRVTVLFWHSAVGTTLLYGAAAIHVSLALLAIHQRRTLRMAPVQGLRIVLGLTMPIVLIGHFVATRYAFHRFGLASEYERIVPNLWAAADRGRQLALLVPGWLHGCLGLHYAFRNGRRWQQLRFVLFGAALLLPVLAALGFVTMGRELAGPRAPARPDGATATTMAASTLRSSALADTRDTALATYAALVALVAAARIARRLDEKRRGATIRISYPQRTAVVPRGWTVLEASRSHGIPHESMCGGRARCTTCRVRVVEGIAHCPPADGEEKRALDRIEADASIRLACQLRPTGDIAVQPLVVVRQAWWRAATPRPATMERELALLFCTFRLHETGTPATASAHDSIYALDRFHRIVSAAIARGGGTLRSQSGESWTALFGLDGRPLSVASAQAIEAAAQIEKGALALVARLARELDLPAEFATGVHVGRVVVGSLGADDQRSLLAIGTALRALERLAAQATQRSARFVISRAAADAAGLELAVDDWQSDGADAAGLAAVDFAVLPSAAA